MKLPPGLASSADITDIFPPKSPSEASSDKYFKLEECV